MEEKVKNNRKQIGPKQIMGGIFLADERVSRQIPFIVFLSVIAFTMIFNRNCSEKTIRQVTVMQDTLDNLRSESITLSSKLMEASKASKIKSKVDKAGIHLDEPLTPPRRIYVDKD
jgi:hypothetical protein